MGATEERHSRQQEQGWSFVDDKWACGDCVAEPFLKEWIRQNATSLTCSYCGHSSTEAPLAIPIDDLFTVIDDGLRTEYHEALDWYSYDSEDGKFVGHWVDSYDLRYELDSDLFNSEALDTTFINAFGDRMFCPAYPHSLSESESFRSGWEDFVYHVKHRARYYFLTDPAAQPSGDDWSDEGLSVRDTPSYLGEAVRALGRIREIGTDVELFRARLSGTGEKYEKARELGTVPEKLASAANRMSPAGIAMFYAAADEDTAIAEVYDASKDSSHTTLASIGVFRPSRPLRVIDLSEQGPLPSLFDDARRHLRERVRMLNEFATAIAQPIEKDSLEHIEYAPTQVVTEYFRFDFNANEEESVDGIMYLSSRNSGHACYVLFVDKEHCGDGDDGSEEVDLRLLLRRAWQKPLHHCP